MLTVQAPAKLNLTLEVLGKRDDGYHEIRSVVQTISLSDLLHFEPATGTVYESDSAEWLAENSLVSKAVELVRSETGHTGGLKVMVEKRIPLMSGLGGDSSDAAAVLKGLDQFWALNLGPEKLHELASSLGSDVPLFLHGGTVLMEGRGERITPLPPLPAMWVVLALPEIQVEPGKTARAYAGLAAGDFTDGQSTDQLVKLLKTGEYLTPSLLFNAFERSTFAAYPELVTCRELMAAAGAENIHLAGSGPALFTLAAQKPDVEHLYDLLNRQGMPVYLAETL